jgi:murein L,D-transpeptidase YafK
VVVAKGQRVLMLMSKENVLKTYHVALGKQPKGPKMREGDGKTPEGHYVIDRRNAKSRFHLALRIPIPIPVTWRARESSECLPAETS